MALPQIVRIQYNSDFTINYKLPKNYDNQDFIVRLYTTDKDNYYEASYRNGEYENCLTDGEHIVIYVNNHNLADGNLHIWAVFDYENGHFQDGVENISVGNSTNVYLVKNNPDATSAMYVGTALPDFTSSVDFVTQSDLEFELLNYYTKEDIDNASYISSSDLNDYVTEEELNDMGFLSQAQLDAMGYATISYVDTKTNQKQDRLINGVNIKTINGNSLLGNGDLVIEGGGGVIDMSAYVTHTFLQNQAYVTQSALNSMSYVTSSQLSNASYVTHAELNSASYVTETELTQAGYVTEQALSTASYVTESQLQQAGYVTQSALNSMSYATTSDLNTAISGINVPTKTSDLTNDSGFITASALNGYVTESQLQQAGYATETYVADYVATHSGPIDLSTYVTYDWLEAQSYVTEQALATASYVTSSDLSNMSYVTTSDLAGYATETYVADYVATHSGPIDLSAYVSKDELNQMGYVSQTDLSNAGYVTQSDLSNMSYVTTSDLNTAISGINVPTKTSDLTNDSGFITSIPAEYVTESELSGMGYVTSTELSNAGYVTGSQISQMGYITSIPSEYVTETELSAKGYITSIPSEYVTQSELSSMSYATTSQLPNMSDYVSHAELNSASYVSKTELSNASYVTQSELSNAGYVTNTSLSNMGYITSVPAEYVTESELSSMSYVTQSALNNASYATTTDLSAYLPLTGGTLSGNLSISGTNGNISSRSVNLGSNIQLLSESSATSNDMAIKIGGNSIFYINSSRFAPNGATNNKAIDLGTSDRMWRNIHAFKYYEDGTNISDKYATKVELTENLIPNTTNTYTLGDSSYLYDNVYTFALNGPNSGLSLRTGGSKSLFLNSATVRPPANNTHSLGTSNYQWAYTYSANFIENGTNIKDIYTQTEVVTQAQYDALTTEEKNSETIYVISDQQAYFDNELVTEQSLSAKGYLTANNFQYDQSTGTLTLIL